MSAHKPKQVQAWECHSCKRLHHEEDVAKWCCRAPADTVEEAQAKVNENLEMLLDAALNPARGNVDFIRFRRTMLRHSERGLRKALARQHKI